MATLTLTTPSGDVAYDVVRTGRIEGSYDRSMFRPPFSTSWKQAGNGDALPESVTVTIEVWGSTAEADIEDVISNAEAATSADSIFWSGSLEGLTSAVVTPTGTGYRVSLTWLTRVGVQVSVIEWQTWGQTDITFNDVSDVTFGELP